MTNGGFLSRKIFARTIRNPLPARRDEIRNKAL